MNRNFGLQKVGQRTTLIVLKRRVIFFFAMTFGTMILTSFANTNFSKLKKLSFLPKKNNSSIAMGCNSCSTASCTTANIMEPTSAFLGVDGVGPNEGCNSSDVRTTSNGSTETFCATYTTPSVLTSNFMSFLGSVPIADVGCDASLINGWTLTSSCAPVTQASFMTIPPDLPIGVPRPVWQIQPNTTYELCYNVTVSGTSCTQISEPCFVPHWVYAPCELFVSTASQDCSANDGTYDLTIQFSNGGQGAGTYTVTNNGAGTLGGDDPNTQVSGIIQVDDITDGSGYDISIVGNQIASGCTFQITSTSYTCSFCPKITSATVESDECVGETITLTASVDNGIEGQDYYIEWLMNGNSITQTGSATFGVDGIYGNADDPSSALTYTHTLSFDNATPSCSFEDQVFTARLYCKTSETLEQGDSNTASTTASVISNYNAETTTCIGLDLTGLPDGVIAESFDYQYRVTSGPPFGQSWICEAILQVVTPAGQSCPLCHPFWAGTCPTQPAGSGVPGPNATTCIAGPGNGFGSILNPSAGPGVENLGGAYSTISAKGNWDVCVFDTYNDTNGATEGVMNYIYIKVNYFLPPGIDVNFAKSSIVDAINISSPIALPSTPITTASHPSGAGQVTGLRVCNAPVVGADFSLPDFANCETLITPVCGDAVVKYSGDGGTTYLLNTPPSPYQNGDEVFYRVTTINCSVGCGTEGSYILLECNKSPVISNHNSSGNGDTTFIENTIGVVENYDATDPDNETENGGGLTWSISGGTDASELSIDVSTGALTFNTLPDYENPADSNFDNIYEVEITVTDAGGLTDVQLLSIDILEDADGDGIIESCTEDRDGDGLVDCEDIDPTGWFYYEHTGEIISGASYTVIDTLTGNDDNVIYHEDGSTGLYRWTVSAPGTYRMILNLPPGYVMSNNCLKQDLPPYDPTGQPDPDIIGSDQNGTTGFLLSSACTPFYLTFDLDFGDPIVTNNNIPIIPTTEISCTDGIDNDEDGLTDCEDTVECLLVGTPGIISGNNSICPNTLGEIFSIATVTNATSYNWTLPAGAVIISGAGTESITVDWGITGGDICVEATDGICPSSPSCLTVTTDVMGPIGPITKN